MKILKISMLIIFVFLAFNCDNDSDINDVNSTLTKEKLIEYLKSRDKNYVFYNDSDKEKRKEIIKSKPLNFDSLEDLEKFLKNVDHQIEASRHHLTYAPTDDVGGGDSGLISFRASYYLGSSFGTYLNIGFSVENCVGSNLNSWISGFTFALSYDHVSGQLNTVNNKIYYQSEGVLHYNVIVQSIGTVFSETLSYSGFTSDCN